MTIDTNANLMLSRGEVFYITSGQYSDYQFHEVMVATVDFDLRAANVEYKLSFTEEEDDWPSVSGFLAYLIARDLAMPVKTRGIHFDAGWDYEIQEDNGNPPYSQQSISTANPHADRESYE